MSDGDTFVVRQGPAVPALLLLTSACFGLVGVLLPFRGGLMIPLGIVIALVSALGAVAVVRILRGRRPALVLDRDGIVDHSLFLGVGRIPWADVVDIRVYRAGRMVYLGIEVLDPDVLWARQAPVKRAWLRANAGLSGLQVNIALRSLSVSERELFEEIRRIRGKRRV